MWALDPRQRWSLFWRRELVCTQITLEDFSWVSFKEEKQNLIGKNSENILLIYLVYSWWDRVQPRANLQHKLSPRDTTLPPSWDICDAIREKNRRPKLPARTYTVKEDPDTLFNHFLVHASSCLWSEVSKGCASWCSQICTRERE